MNLVASKKYALTIFSEFQGRLEGLVLSGVNMLITRPEAAPQTFALCPSCIGQQVSQSFLLEPLLTYYLSSTVQLSFFCFCFQVFLLSCPRGWGATVMFTGQVEREAYFGKQCKWPLIKRKKQASYEFVKANSLMQPYNGENAWLS